MYAEDLFSLQKATYSALGVAGASRIHRGHPERFLFTYWDLPLALLGVESTLWRPATGMSVEACNQNFTAKRKRCGEEVDDVKGKSQECD
jgi:hypothetical protein